MRCRIRGRFRAGLSPGCPADQQGLPTIPSESGGYSLRPVFSVKISLTLALAVAGASLFPGEVSRAAQQPFDWRQDWAAETGFNIEIDPEGFEGPTAITFVGSTGVSVLIPLGEMPFFTNEGEPKTSPFNLYNLPSTTLAWKISSPFWNRPMEAMGRGY